MSQERAYHHAAPLEAGQSMQGVHKGGLTLLGFLCLPTQHVFRGALAYIYPSKLCILHRECARAA